MGRARARKFKNRSEALFVSFGSARGLSDGAVEASPRDSCVRARPIMHEVPRLWCAAESKVSCSVMSVYVALQRVRATSSKLL
ncbi:hypothetical protein MRX96_016125 [Rhipicephalus microplus]